MTKAQINNQLPLTNYKVNFSGPGNIKENFDSKNDQMFEKILGSNRVREPPKGSALNDSMMIFFLKVDCLYSMCNIIWV